MDRPLERPWKKRIVGNGDVAPADLIEHDSNFRIHPGAQKEALRGVIEDIGFIRSVTVNKRTNRIDGHLRVQLALEAGQETIPVEYVDLTEEEEAEALAAIDPLAALADVNKPKLDALLHEIRSPSSAVQQMLTDLARRSGLAVDKPMLVNDQTDQLKGQFQVLVTGTSEDQQAELLERLIEEGLECRSLIS